MQTCQSHRGGCGQPAGDRVPSDIHAHCQLLSDITPKDEAWAAPAMVVPTLLTMKTWSKQAPAYIPSRECHLCAKSHMGRNQVRDRVTGLKGWAGSTVDGVGALGPSICGQCDTTSHKHRHVFLLGGSGV